MSPRERPILFSDSMVRRVRDGSKLLTRRVVSARTSCSGSWPMARFAELSLTDPVVSMRSGAEVLRTWVDPGGCLSPVGQQYLHVPHRDGETVHRVHSRIEVGDRLWVRECFALSQRDPDDAEVSMLEPQWWDAPVYRADGDQGGEWTDGAGRPIPPPWRPSIHMPRWASRLVLEVTTVRVERLQEISEEDARAEGVTIDGRVPGEQPIAADRRGRTYGSHPHVAAFASLWDSLASGRSPASWAADPWVWVIGFRRAVP